MADVAEDQPGQTEKKPETPPQTANQNGNAGGEQPSAPNGQPVKTPEQAPPSQPAKAVKKPDPKTDKNQNKKNAPPPAQPKAPPPSASDHPPVMLSDRFAIHPGAPLPELNTPSAKAYAVQDAKEPSRRLYALICTPGLPPRTQAMSNLKGVETRGLMPLVDYGVVNWKPMGCRTMAIIYGRPMGGKLAEDPWSTNVRISEYDMAKTFLALLIPALHELANINVPHRAIRPDNLYYMDEERTQLVIGDCVTTPPGYDQPVIFEAIQRAMASPGGRGQGSPADDLYSLGVSIVFLLLGHNPVHKMKRHELISSKIEYGSYATLCSRTRVPVSLLEPLRGLLIDETRERWTTQELELWVNGKRQTPKQRKTEKRAKVPFSFIGRDYHSPRSLANDMTLNVAEAAKVIKDGSLSDWIRRSMEAPEQSEAISKANEEAKLHPTDALGSNDYLVCKVAMLLDPLGPIRYRGFAFLPEGFGTAMAVEFMKKGNAQLSATVLNLELPALWITAQNVSGPDITGLAKAFSKLRNHLKINDPGYGIERCLYELNPTLPCQSQIVGKDYVVDIEDLLPYLDEAASRVDGKSKPLDRHVIAFIAARFDQDIDPHLRALADPKENVALIGMLSLLAYLQWKLKADPMYGLASWIGGLLGPAINTYHSRTTRREIEREIPKLVRQGSLPDLFDLIDNADKRKADIEGYNNARAQYAAAQAEIIEIEGKGSEHKKNTERIAQQTASMSSIILAMIVVSVLILAESW